MHDSNLSIFLENVEAGVGFDFVFSSAGKGEVVCFGHYPSISFGYSCEADEKEKVDVRS